MEISAKKITKFLLKIFLGLLCLLAIIILLLRVPAVQTKIAAKLTSILSKQLKTQIDIKAVAINFVDNATIKGIYIEDLNKDTMLYAGNLVVDIGFFKLLSSEIIIESLKLENAVVNVSQNQDSIFNFKFLIDRLTKPDTTAKVDAKPINFRIDLVGLHNIRATADLLSGKHTLSVKELELVINSTDLNNKKFDIKSIDIIGLQLQSRLKKQKELAHTKSDGIFPLSGLPINLKVGEINITESNISYQNGDAPLSKYFDPDNINAKSINIAINDIQLDSLGITAKINQLALNLNNRIDLKRIQGQLRFDDYAASINDFSFNTSASKGKMSVKISYPTFADLIKSLDSARAELQMDSLSISIPDIAYFVPQLDTISAIKPFKNQLLSLDGNASGNLAEMDINYINAAISQTSVKIEGTIFNLTDVNNLNVLDGLVSGQSNIEDLKKIVDVRKFGTDINQFGNISFQALFSGSMKSLDLGDFNLFTEGKLQAQLSGNIKNLNNPDLIKYDLKIYNLATGYKDLRVFIDSLPQLATEVKDLRYTGSLSGTKTAYNLNGKFATTVGDIATNIKMAFTKDFSNASYKGKIALKDFNLRQLLQNDSLGKVTLNASVDGSGLSIDQLKTSLKLTVDRFDFNSYSYNNLNVFGEVDKKEFEGKIRMNDKNIVFNFNGLVNLNDSLPVLNFDAKIDTLDLYALHLLTYPLKMQMSINANMLGSTPDNVEGSLKISNIVLQNPDKKWRADSITFTATTKSPKNRTLLLDAPFAKMEVSGNYKVANLSKIIINFADQYFPFSNLIGGKQVADVLPPSKEQEIRDEKINFNLKVIDPTALARMFNIDLKKLDSARVSFALDAPEKLLNFELYVPEIEYAGFYADSIYGHADNTGNRLVALFGVDSIRLTETISIPSLSLEATMSDKQSVFKLLVEGDSSGYNLGLTTKLTAPNGDILLEFQNPLYLKGTEWSITQSKAFNLSKIERTIPQFTIASNGQKLTVSGDTTQLKLNFQQFHLNTLMSLVKIDSTTVDGMINGDIQLGIVPSNPIIAGVLDIRDIIINTIPVGTLSLNAQKSGENIKAAIKLSGNQTDIKSNIAYSLNSKVIDGNIDINAFDLTPYSPFVKNFAKNLTGYLSGNLAIKGNLENPQLTGILRFKDASAFILTTGTTYGIQTGTITLEDGVIRPNITLIDNEKRTASLQGSIRHEYFRKMAFDLQLKADNFTFLNSEKSTDVLFYGKFIADINADITGGIDLPKIRATITTRKNTDMTVQLISPEVVLNQESYMVFVNGVQNYTAQQIDSIAQVSYHTNFAMDLMMNVNLTDDATMRIVTDPITGDNLEIKGNSQLVVKIPENGQLSITGIYEVKEGNYRFSYQNILKRDFALVPGSRIVFIGNPMDSRLDLKAKFSTQASTLPLIDNDISGLSDEETRALRKRAEVSILLSILGKLSSPELKFDIQIAEENSGPVGSSVTQALERLRANESDINREVFSILLFKSFSGNSSNGNITATGSATAVRSIGNLINSQLNKLTNNIEGFQLDFGLDQYQDQVSEGGGNVTQLDLGASQALFKDRVVLSVGSNVDLESGNSDREGFSSITGDFVLEYKLTESGKYRVKVFQKSDYDALNADNLWKTGVGFSYKTKFGKKKKPKKK